MAKFHEKNQAIYFGLQTGSGSANKLATSALGSTTAIACTAISGDPTRDTGSYQYLGDSLSRDEYTYEKDKYIDLQIDTFQQVLSDMTTAIVANDASLWKLYQVCGGNVIVDSATKQVFVDNATDSPDYGTADFRKSTPDDATNDKLYKFWDLRGTVDVTATVGEVPSLKFSLKGNVDDPAPVAKQVADFGKQTTRVAPSVLYSTITSAYLVEISPSDTFAASLGGTISGVTAGSAQINVNFSSAPSGVATGQLRRVSISGLTPTSLNGEHTLYFVSPTRAIYYVKGNTSAASGTAVIKVSDVAPSTFCFSTLNAANFFGYDFQRYMTGCDTGFAKGGTPTDVSVSMLEDQAGASGVFLPDTKAGSFFSAVLQFGKKDSGGALVAGTGVTYMWDKLQLANVKQGKIATYLGRDVTFRNTGSSFIFYQ
jgi:hypothetical protein